MGGFIIFIVFVLIIYLISINRISNNNSKEEIDRLNKTINTLKYKLDKLGESAWSFKIDGTKINIETKDIEALDQLKNYIFALEENKKELEKEIENWNNEVSELKLENKVLRKEIEKLKTKLILRDIHNEIDEKISKNIVVKLNMNNLKKSITKLGYPKKDVDSTLNKVLETLNEDEFTSEKEQEDHIFKETVKILSQE